jgi:hypothetical protein
MIATPQTMESAATMTTKVLVAIRPAIRIMRANKTNGIEKIAMIEANRQRAPHSFMPESPLANKYPELPGAP